MGKSDAYKKIYIKYKLGVFILFVECLLLTAFNLICSKSSLYFVINVIISALIILLSYKVIAEYMKDIVAEKCDLLSYKKFLEYLIQKRKIGNKIKLYIALVKIDMELDEFDEALKILEGLKKNKKQLSEEQKLYLQYMYVVSLEKLGKNYQIEEDTLLEKMEDSKHIKKKVIREIEEGIHLRKMIKSCEWNELILEQKDKHLSNIYQQVKNMYLLGMCYCKVGDYENAYNKLKFAERRGGSSKYVQASRNLLWEIPVQNIMEKPEKVLSGSLNKIALYIMAVCLLTAVLFFGNGYARYGDSVESAYRLENHINNSIPVRLIYSYKTDKYEIAVLWDKKYLSYSLLEHRDTGQGVQYKVCDSYRLEKDFLYFEKKQEEGEVSEDEEVNINSSAKFHVEWLIKRFYKSSNIFEQENIPCIGVSCNPNIERLEIDGRNVEVIGKKEVEDWELYVWKAENIDYGSIDYSDILISDNLYDGSL